jgi:hypothetical protein
VQRGQPWAYSPENTVVSSDSRPRTQNGHIRNDTRDVSRRIAGPLERPICRRNDAADDRACPRIPFPNFHGKEGVDGSSPSEGLGKAPANWTLMLSVHKTRGHISDTSAVRATRRDVSRRLASHGPSEAPSASIDESAASGFDRCLSRRGCDPSLQGGGRRRSRSPNPSLRGRAHSRHRATLSWLAQVKNRRSATRRVHRCP